MDTPQAATINFFGPVACAYLMACGGWLLYNRLRPRAWDEPPTAPTQHPYVDLGTAVAAAVAILVLGGVYRAGWLLPTGGHWLSRLGWIVDNLIIYSPIAIVLAIRRQGPATVYLSGRRVGEKIGVGLLLGLTSLIVYTAPRGELANVPQMLASTVDPQKLVDFLPVFMEGVAMAFAFVRLRWAIGLPAALAMPAALFALAHVPGQIESGSAAWEIAAFFVFNAALAAAITYTVQRSRDVIWIGMVHYLMDIAIQAI